MFRRALAPLALVSMTSVACTPKEETRPQPAASASAVLAPAAKAGVDVGDVAPAVTLPLQDGRTLDLASLKGKNVAVYFYPKDETPGCTVEAQGFRDHAEDLKKADVTVIGVSAQDAASHKAFIEKEKLPFDLAIDADQAVAKAFGVPVRGGFHARWTFLIGRDGKIKKVWRDVSPKEHAAEVIAAANS